MAPKTVRVKENSNPSSAKSSNDRTQSASRVKLSVLEPVSDLSSKSHALVKATAVISETLKELEDGLFKDEKENAHETVDENSQHINGGAKEQISPGNQDIKERPHSDYIISHQGYVENPCSIFHREGTTSSVFQHPLEAQRREPAEKRVAESARSSRPKPDRIEGDIGTRVKRHGAQSEDDAHVHEKGRQQTISSSAQQTDHLLFEELQTEGCTEPDEKRPPSMLRDDQHGTRHYQQTVQNPIHIDDLDDHKAKLPKGSPLPLRAPKKDIESARTIATTLSSAYGKQNHRVHLTMEGTEYMDPGLISSLHKQLRYMEDNNRRLRDQISRRSNKDEDATVGFLRRRIQQLEKENARLQAQCDPARKREERIRLSELSGRCRHLENDNHELQTRVSRHHIELKALIEQNEILRRENKRLTEQETALKMNLGQTDTANIVDKKHEMLNASTNTVLSTTPDRVDDDDARQDVLRLIDSETHKLRDKKCEIASTPRYSSDGSSMSTALNSPMRTMDTLLNGLDAIRAAVTSSSIVYNPSHFLAACKDVTQVVTVSAHAFSAALEESLLVEDRIHRLREDSTKIRAETERTIKTIADSYASDMQKLQDDNETLEGNLEKIQTEFEKIKKAYKEEQEKRMREVALAREAAMVAEKGRLAVLKEVQEHEALQKRTQIDSDTCVDWLAAERTAAALLEEETKTASYEKRIDELTAITTQMQAHQEHLERTIEKWKRENVTLRASLEKMYSAPAATEAEFTKLRKSIDMLESKLDDEKLKNQQATEIIDNLQEDLRRKQKELENTRTASVGGDSAWDPSADLLREIGRTLTDKVNGLQQHHGEPSPCRDNLCDVEALMELLKNNQDTSNQLEQLNGMIEEHVHQLSALRAENSSLKEALSKTKDKLKSREDAWMGKFKTLQASFEDVKSQHRELEQLLTDYEKQYQHILPYAADSDRLTDDRDHPLPFVKQFLHIHNLHVSANNSAALLQQKVAEGTKTSEAQLLEIQALTARHESERDRIQSLERTTEGHIRRIEELQKDVKLLGEQKAATEAKLKRIVNGFRKFISGPIKSTSDASA
ncbi:uncharacterized protein SPPG_08603 [Spizellomyces punctatus DAOM BR117]|uniref:Uncharacterized protein n=1 Tax=Spizellomyces punctatus (strain DAOM BR117) TaxID=645134 RepID=A0A0L0H4V9_SPIPD|nr:uncharacterized protein SPPG_08603 [Spizellomyces punctatus DAOM BR117]KNC96004.1 hypothetical protein SPPG_08603 [Spizellomyces punctatus DAOM BR117]|eukprot:XP_016604044.1 hypothetical protein SPPG_08603 [Spizellomyces punctatus DAOM BR117]